jgi:trimethylamine--corrinoid protein Co-methyltransferase
MGLTAPLSITGALAITAANYLAALVIKKAIDPDNRDVFPVMAGSFNMKNGEIITSSPEIWQYYIAGIKLARHYNIPSFVLAASDAKDLDIQAVFEKAAAFFISSGAGVNNIFAATNDLDAMNLAVYEGAVIELEILSALSGFLKNLKVPGPGIDFEIIRSGLENKMFFLEESHTISNFREFIWNTDIFIKDNYLSWKKTGMKKIAEIASRKAKDILSTHEPVRLPVETIREIDRIIDSYAKSVNNR